MTRRASVLIAAALLASAAMAKARRPSPSPEAVAMAFCETDFNGQDVAGYRADAQDVPSDDDVTVVSTFTMTGSFSSGGRARVMVKFEELGHVAGAGFTKEPKTTRVEFLLSQNLDGRWEIDGPPYERRWSPATAAARLRRTANGTPQRPDREDLLRAADEIAALKPSR